MLRALAAYDAGRWDEARRLFERAHGLDPTARTLRTIGMAAFNQGDFIGALQNLEASLVDPRKPLTDEQRRHVRGLIERANHHVGRYRLRLRPPGASLLVDDKSPTLVGQDELLLLPGRHELRVSAPGYPTRTRTLDVQAQDRAPLELSLLPSGAATPPATGGAKPALQTASATAPAPAGGGHSARHAVGWVVLSVGGASLVASAVTFGLALGQKSELDSRCPGRVCPPAEHGTVQHYDTLRALAGTTFGVGVAGAAVGLVLLLGGGHAGSEHASLQPLLGPGYAGVRGAL